MTLAAVTAANTTLALGELQDAVKHLTALIPVGTKEDTPITVTVDDTAAAVSLVTGATTARITLTATDRATGRITVSARALKRVLTKLGDKRSDITITGAQDGSAALTANGVCLTLAALDPTDALEPDTRALVGVIPGGELRTAWPRLSAAVSDDKDYPVLHHAHLTPAGDGTAILETTDRFRLARHTVSFDAADNGHTEATPIPAELMKLAAALATEDDDVAVYATTMTVEDATRPGVVLTCAGFTAGARVAEQRLPDTSQVMPTSVDLLATVDSKEMASKLTKLAPHVDDRKMVLLHAVDGWIEVSVGGSEVRAMTRVAAEMAYDVDRYGEGFHLAFNIGYLIDAIKAAKAPTVTLASSCGSDASARGRSVVMEGIDGIVDQAQDASFALPERDYLHVVMGMPLPRA